MAADYPTRKPLACGSTAVPLAITAQRSAVLIALIVVTVALTLPGVPAAPSQTAAQSVSSSASQQEAASLPSSLSLEGILPYQMAVMPHKHSPADIAVKGESVLKIVGARLTDWENGSKKLQVSIKESSHERIDSSQEKVQVYFYDQDGDKIVPSKAQVTSKWLNWLSGEPQSVEVSYLPESVNRGVRFAGYVVTVYYKGDLQDCLSKPARLRKLFEPKYYIGTDK